MEKQNLNEGKKEEKEIKNSNNENNINYKKPFINPNKKFIEPNQITNKNPKSKKGKFDKITINLQKQFDEIPTNAESIFQNINYNINDKGLNYKDLISESSQSSNNSNNKNDDKMRASQQTLIDDLKEKLNLKFLEIDKEDFISKKKKIYDNSYYQEYIPNITFENKGNIYSFKLFNDLKIGFENKWNKLFENVLYNESDEEDIEKIRENIFHDLQNGIDYLKSKSNISNNIKDIILTIRKD